MWEGILNWVSCGRGKWVEHNYNFIYNTLQIVDEHVPVIVGGVVMSTDNLDQAVMCYHAYVDYTERVWSG